MSKSNRGHQLIDELSHYDNQTGVNDILTGKYLDAIQALPQHIRQMMEDSEMHIVLSDDNRILKIIRMRDAEYLVPQEKYFWLDTDGTRVNLSEEEMDAKLGIVHNPEDIYNTEEVELEGLGEVGVWDEEFVEDDDADFDLTQELVEDESVQTVVSECVPCMDKWDIIYDATEFVQHCKALISVARFIIEVKAELSQDYWKSDVDAKLNTLNDMFQGGFIISRGMFKEALMFNKLNKSEKDDYLVVLADDLIYSADWFMPLADKRIRNKVAKQLKKDAGSLTKQELAAALSSKVDARVKGSIELTAKAVNMPLGKNKAKTLLRAQAMKLSRINSLRSMRAFRYVPEDLESEDNKRWILQPLRAPRSEQTISQSETKIIWDSWRDAQVAKDGYSKLPSWLFKKAYSKKLLAMVSKGIISYDDATIELNDRMLKLYNIEGVGISNY